MSRLTALVGHIPDKNDSPFMAFVRTAYAGYKSSRRNSRQGYESVRGQALAFAVENRFRAAKGDLAKVVDEFGWLLGIEHLYSLACVYGHDLMANEVERHFSRKPFWYTPVRHGYAMPKVRLHEGSQFTWKGEKVKCTSFDGSKGCWMLIACSYKSNAEKQAIYEEEKYEVESAVTEKVIEGQQIERKELFVHDRRYKNQVKNIYRITYAMLAQRNDQVRPTTPEEIATETVLAGEGS